MTTQALINAKNAAAYRRQCWLRSRSPADAQRYMDVRNIYMWLLRSVAPNQQATKPAAKKTHTKAAMSAFLTTPTKE